MTGLPIRYKAHEWPFIEPVVIIIFFGGHVVAQVREPRFPHDGYGRRPYPRTWSSLSGRRPLGLDHVMKYYKPSTRSVFDLTPTFRFTYWTIEGYALWAYPGITQWAEGPLGDALGHWALWAQCP